MDLSPLVSYSDHGTYFKMHLSHHYIWQDVVTLHLFKSLQYFLGVTFLCITCNQYSLRDNIICSQSPSSNEHLSCLFELGMHVHQSIAKHNVHQLTLSNISRQLHVHPPYITLQRQVVLDQQMHKSGEEYKVMTKDKPTTTTSLIAFHSMETYIFFLEIDLIIQSPTSLHFPLVSKPQV